MKYVKYKCHNCFKLFRLIKTDDKFCIFCGSDNINLRNPCGDFWNRNRQRDFITEIKNDK